MQHQETETQEQSPVPGIIEQEPYRQEKIKKRMDEAPGILQSILMETGNEDWAVDGLLLVLDLLANRLKPERAVSFAYELQCAVFTQSRVFERSLESYGEMLVDDFNLKEAASNELEN